MPSIPFAALGTAYTAYSAARSAVQAVTHPITWVRDKIKSLLIDTFVDLALSALKQEHKDAIVSKVQNHQKTVNFSVPIPTILQSSFSQNTAALAMLHELANDAMAAPLALLGYRVGTLELQWDEDAKAVRSVLELGIRNT